MLITHTLYAFMDSNEYYSLLIASVPELYCHALRLTKSGEEAKDLLQDTALQLLEKNRLYVDKNFIGWGYTHLHNRFLNSLRQHKAHTCDTKTLVNIAQCRPEECTSYDIQQAIEHLSPALRTVMQMYLEGYKYDEIAEIRHIPTGTVKSRIARARRILQIILQDYRKQLP